MMLHWWDAVKVNSISPPRSFRPDQEAPDPPILYIVHTGRGYHPRTYLGNFTWSGKNGALLQNQPGMIRHPARLHVLDASRLRVVICGRVDSNSRHPFDNMAA